MQISLKWVNELVDLETINLNSLIEKLTLSGFEVEEFLEVEIDNQKTVALDISATTNRSDSLSIKGIALEIAGLLNKVPQVSTYSTKTFNWEETIEHFSNISLTKDECLGFISITLENLTNLTSPKWLKRKLIASGITPEDNLTDFQNYILLETGYPFEFYDLDKIYSKTNSSKVSLNLTYNQNIQEFLANDGVEYKLNDSILILTANNLPISIAGIISSKDVCWSNSTKCLLIEGSIFNSTKIRQQTRMLGLRTTRSSRYEKSLKSTNLLESFYRLVSLLRISNPNLISKLHTLAQPSEKNLVSITLDYQNVNKILGPVNSSFQNGDIYISPEIITDSLKRLKFKINYNEKNLVWQVTVPHLRSDDIVREIDLIEEIGRLYGFNNFLTRVPNIKTIGKEDYNYQIRKKLTYCLLNLGLNELIHYSLVDKETYISNDIELLNPLVKDYSNLRSSLLPNLLKTVQENLKKSNSIIEGFEYGHVFSRNILKSIIEKEHIAGIFGGIKTKLSWSDSAKLLNWFEAKGRIEELFKKLNIIIYWKASLSLKNQNILHPYCTAELYLANGNKLGDFGQIHPILAKKLNLPIDLYLFEFDFELIQNQIQTNKLLIYQQYSSYPKIIKDLSFIINDQTSFENLKTILYLNGSKFLTKINLLDEYRGTSIPENHTSLCLQLIFQSEQKTLQNKKVENIVDNLKNLLTSKFNATIRI
jgi:phenylalanyl-tRNA synthetase beta chain